MEKENLLIAAAKNALLQDDEPVLPSEKLLKIAVGACEVEYSPERVPAQEEVQDAAQVVPLNPENVGDGTDILPTSLLNEERQHAHAGEVSTKGFIKQHFFTAEERMEDAQKTGGIGLQETLVLANPPSVEMPEASLLLKSSNKKTTSASLQEKQVLDLGPSHDLKGRPEIVKMGDFLHTIMQEGTFLPNPASPNPSRNSHAEEEVSVQVDNCGTFSAAAAEKPTIVVPDVSSRVSVILDAPVHDGKIASDGHDGKANVAFTRSLPEEGGPTSGVGISHDSATPGEVGKTELEREMELFEAAEREEEARLLTSLRFEQPDELGSSKQSPSPTESSQGDRKRAPELIVPEQRPKRGRKPIAHHPPPKEEEDVCFVCFDGGNLILCDKKSCPKAYHVECTGRESEFFEKRGQWFCGWHVCAYCSRSATTHCYTCPNAFCNNCVKDSDFLSIRKGRGLCEVCYPIVQMIEHNETVNADGVQVDFSDQETYECLFKDYWDDLKRKLSLTSTEVEKACKAKEAGEPIGNDVERVVGEEEAGSTDSDSKPRTRLSSRLSKRKRTARTPVLEDASGSEYEEEGEEDDDDEAVYKSKRGRMKVREFDGWASRELLEFLQSMKEDTKKAQSLLAVKNLLWRYVEGNKLFNPRRRGQILCDERLQKLFGKKNVGRFEMLKLLSFHIAATRGSVKGWNNNTGDPENSDDTRGSKPWDKYRKSRRKSDDNRQAKPDPSEYAAVDVKNMTLIYLKRSLLDDLRGDPDFKNKVVGSFVRIRVPGMVNKNDTCYRLVKVVGIKQNPEKIGDVILEIMNLQKREEVTADLVSSQDFTEEECQRLRQSIRYGVLQAMTVGELEEKAQALREAKIKDWFETELLRLSHLRDRASEKGHKKELRECVEKIQLLSSQEEKERRLRLPLEIKADPHMNPNYESEDEEAPLDDPQDKWERALPPKAWEKCNDTDRSHTHWDNGEANAKSGTWDTKPRAAGWSKKEHNSSLGAESQNQGVNPVHSTLNESKNGWGSTGDGWNDGWDNLGGVGEKEGGSSWANEVSSPGRDTGWNQESSNKMESGGGGWGDKTSSMENSGWNHERSDRKETGGGWGDGVGNTEKNLGWNHQGSSDQMEERGGWGASVSNTETNIGWNHQGSFDKRENGRWKDGVGSIERKGGWNSQHQKSFERKDSSGWGRDDVGSMERTPGWNGHPSFSRKEGSLDREKPTYNRMEGSGTVNSGSSDWRGKKDHNMGGRFGAAAAHMPPAMAEMGNTTSTIDGEKEKIWFYQDPTKTIQGPFSMEQLRKWEKTKLFPLDLRVWRKTEGLDASVLLSDALAGRLVSNSSQTRWAVSVASERDSRNSSLSNKFFGGVRGVRDQGGFGGTMNKTKEGGAWGGGWSASANTDDGGWGTKSTDGTWGEPPQGAGDGSLSKHWGGGEASFRGPGHHHNFRSDKPVQSADGGWGARSHGSWGLKGTSESPQAGRGGALKGNWGGREGSFGEGRFPTRKKDVACKYFERGMCRKGQSCDFKH